MVTQSFHDGTHIGTGCRHKLRKLLMCYPDVHDITTAMIAWPPRETHQINECHRNPPLQRRGELPLQPTIKKMQLVAIGLQKPLP